MANKLLSTQDPTPKTKGKKTTLTLDEQMELLFLNDLLKTVVSRNKIIDIFPDEGPYRRELYPKHIEFFNAGKDNRQRLLMAANRVGKTMAAGCELTYHLTGVYPDWWQGRRFTKPQDWWVAGKDSSTVRVILQELLLGPVGEFGTGLIPHDKLDFETLKDAKKADTPIDKFRVKHTSGTYSTVEFKSYDAGRKSFEGTARSIWLDEEPPLSVYTECLLRTMTGENLLLMTFTPLQGISETITTFLGSTSFETLLSKPQVGDGKIVIMASWDDVPHLSEEAKRELLASIPPYQRDARSRGIPQLGSGVVYPIPESEYLVDPFAIPKHWPKFGGLDVGWNKTAAIWGAIEPETNIIYLYSEHYRGDAEPSIHAQSIKARGEWIPLAIDTAARGRSQIDGENLYQMYQDLGLSLLNADKSVETGLYTCWQLLSEGRIKVFKTLTNFLNEIRLYRRDEKGKIIKTNDHLMDSWRYSIMSGRNAAITEPAPYDIPTEGFIQQVSPHLRNFV
jgi:phage terminase large subunit-like protein